MAKDTIKEDGIKVGQEIKEREEAAFGQLNGANGHHPKKCKLEIKRHQKSIMNQMKNNMVKLMKSKRHH